jgi:hypothetical protein
MGVGEMTKIKSRWYQSNFIQLGNRFEGQKLSVDNAALSTGLGGSNNFPEKLSLMSVYHISSDKPKDKHRIHYHPKKHVKSPLSNIGINTSSFFKSSGLGSPPSYPKGIWSPPNISNVSIFSGNNDQNFWRKTNQRSVYERKESHGIKQENT